MAEFKVFVGYSHLDEEWKVRVVKHLRVIMYEGGLDPWDDSRTRIGEEWEKNIERAVDTASAAVLLVSADSLNSEYILHKEVPRLLGRRDKERLPIFPIVVKPCAWNRVPWLAKLEVRPKGGKALSQGAEAEIDSNLAAITEEIADRVQPSPPSRWLPSPLLAQPLTPPLIPWRPSVPPLLPPQVLGLQAPVITHNALRAGVYFMDLRVPGQLHNYVGGSAQIVLRFFFQNGPALFANPSERTYFDTQRKVAAYTSKIQIIANPFDLAGHPVSIPYYALNLTPTRSTMTYSLSTHADIYVNDAVVAQTPPAFFTVRW